jgi:enoyl-CoA hydratase/carnithine racemase
MAEALRAAGIRPGDDVPYQEAPIDRCIRLVETAPKPVIAAINGECMGGAMELALGCDIRFAQAGPYRLGQPETLLGILPGAGGTQRLARVVGPAAAMEHALTGLPVVPEEALRLGMVHAVVADALGAARARARHFASIPATVLAHTKRLVREARTLPLDEGLKLERALFVDLAIRDEGMRLMRAYEAGEYDFRLEGDRWTVRMP